MNQRTFLGLTHNPFTPPREGFFAGGDRKTHLDHLRHLSQWSRRILVVTGAFGVGKSSLFKELSGSLEPNTRAARLSGTVVTTERDALVSLLQGFGIAADLNAHVEDLSDLVVRHVEEQDAQNRGCLVMLDDAHLMDIQAITRLVTLVSKSALRLLLFAEPALVSDLNRVVKKLELEWFEIRLTGFPTADVREYLEWRFNQAHYRGRLPFTDEQLAKIVDRSGGNPSVIDSMANRLLADMESGDIRARTSRFPATHLLLVVLLAVMVGLFYLLLLDEDIELGGDTVVAGQPEQAAESSSEELSELIPADGPTGTATEAGADQIYASNNTPAQTDDLALVAIGDTAQPQEGLDADTQLQGEVSTVDIGPSGEMAGDEPMAAPLAGATSGQNDAAQESSSNVESVASTDTVATQTAQEVAEQTADQVLEEASQDTNIATSPELPATQTPAVSTTPTSSPAESVTQEPTSLTDVLADTEAFNNAQWILEQKPGRFTMQLLTLSSRERAKTFIERQESPSEFAVYRLNRDGRTLHVITYGVFSSKAGAEAAVAGFTGEMATLKPWIRPFALVQDTVRGTPQG